MTKLKKSVLLLLASLALLNLAPGLAASALAQDPNINEQEKAVFAFHKLTKGVPNYQKLIESMKEYNEQDSMFKKQEVYEKESLRLKWGFGVYDPKKDYLNIETDIYLQLRISGKTPTLNFKFVNSRNIEVPYFPYPYGDEWVAVIANGLGRFTSIPLTKEQYGKLKELFEAQKVYEGKLAMKLRPISADNSSPLIMDRIKQWLVMADIAFLEFLYIDPETDERQTLLGSYKAPWYISEGKDSTAPLFKN